MEEYVIKTRLKTFAIGIFFFFQILQVYILVEKSILNLFNEIKWADMCWRGKPINGVVEW